MDTNRNGRRNTLLVAAAGAITWLSFACAQAQTAPIITQQPLTQAVTPGSTVTFSVTVAGSGPFLYQWRFNGASVPGIITTVAGNGSNAFFGTGVQATNAALSEPWGVAVDVSNNLYIADWQNSRIRKVATNGLITTFAGSGATNFHGDGGQAASAGLNLPRGVSADSLGNVFICDTADNRVRKVITNGVITTVAGGGTNNIGDGGAATNATLNLPTAAAVDALGNLFIADTGNNRIRKVGTNGIITTVAGGGTLSVVTNGLAATNAAITQPLGIAVDRFGNLFFSCGVNGGEGVLSARTNGTITLLGALQLYGDTYFGMPSGVALDVAGNVFDADFQDNVVLKAGVFQPVAGTAQFTGQQWIGVTGAYSGDNGPANQAALFGPEGVAVDAAGDLFIGDLSNNRIRKVTPLGPVLSMASVATSNAGNYDVVVSNPYGSVTSIVAVLSIGTGPGLTNQMTNVTAIVGSNAILNATATGAGPFTYQWQFNGTNLPIIITTVAGDGQDGESGDGGQATNAALYAGGVGVGGLGNFFIADSANERVREVNASGLIATFAGDGTTGFSGDGLAATNAELYNPAAVAVDSSGNVYIADEANARIRVVATNGLISTFAGDGTEGYSGDGAAATNESLSSPSGVAVDASGNLYIADKGNNRIRQVGTNGIINTIAGNGTNGFSGDGGAAINASLSNPEAVAVDGLGNVFIADSGNKRIRKVASNGIIITVAGNGDGGYYGDGGLATNAFFEAPAGVAVDVLGNIFIADGTEHVREVGVNGIISTTAGNAGFGFGGDGGSPTNSMLSEVYGLATDAFGGLYMADTGNNRIRKINAFGPSLPLNNFNLGEAGMYDLIVSNPFGSVTSAVIVVTAVLPPPPPLPLLTASLSGNDSLTIQFSGTPGSNYVLQVTANLTPPVIWQPLATNVAGINGSGTFIETNILATPASYYRLALP